MGGGARGFAAASHSVWLLEKGGAERGGVQLDGRKGCCSDPTGVWARCRAKVASSSRYSKQEEECAEEGP